MNSGTENILLVLFEVIESLVPFAIFFALFQRIYLKLPFSQLIKLYTGLILAGFGIVLFLYGVYSGLFPVGREIGMFFGRSEKKAC